MYTFVAEEQANPDCAWSVTLMCRVLQVSRSGFYDWQSRPPSDREVTDRLLAAEIEAIWECSARTYGAPRVHAWLRRQGYRVARKRVARIMREHGWAGVMGRIRVRTTRRDKTAAPAPDLVARAFNPDAPDQLWAGDVTYLRTSQGWLYLATVIDLYSRRVIGWALATHLRADLVCAALQMAVATRGGRVDGVVFHSDRGCQYTSRAFRRLCAHEGVTQSMGATGVCWDNSPSEAFFATLKRELVHRHTWPTRRAVRLAVVRWIEWWYNARRLHSSLQYQAPIEKEAAYQQAA
jgi:putative transposase